MSNEDKAELKYLLEERAGIMQYDSGYPENTARIMAKYDIDRVKQELLDDEVNNDFTKHINAD